MRMLIDANVHHGVGKILFEAGHDVDYVTKSFLEGTPDDEIETFARSDGWIIVSHDKRFLTRIQQPRYNFADPANTGFGRIMLMTSPATHLVRIGECLRLIELLHTESISENKRFLLVIGDHFIRFEDKPRRASTSN
jgi:hypothetical protein